MTLTIRDKIDGQWVGLPDGRIGQIEFISAGSVAVKTRGDFRTIHSLASLDGCPIAESRERIVWSPDRTEDHPSRGRRNSERYMWKLRTDSNLGDMFDRFPYVYRDEETGEEVEFLQSGPWACVRAFCESWLRRYPTNTLSHLAAVVVKQGDENQIPLIILHWAGNGLNNPINLELCLDDPPPFRCGCQYCRGDRVYRVTHLCE
jgi:hypothetical protein